MLRNCLLCKQLIRTISLCVLPGLLIFMPFTHAATVFHSNSSYNHSSNAASHMHDTSSSTPPLIVASIVDINAIKPVASSDFKQPAEPGYLGGESHFILLWVMGVISFCAITLYLSSLRRFR